MKISIASSPDSDDTFMMYALKEGKIKSSYEFEFYEKDIETLNKKASEGEYDITAVSANAFSELKEYDLLSCGASFGEGYGPVIVGRKKINASELKGKIIAIPGKKTSAFLALKLFEPEIKYKTVKFDQIIEKIKEKKFDFGLVIHEDQLKFKSEGLHKILDLGEWWKKETGLPLPLGVIVIRKRLDEKIKKALEELIRKSIEYSLENRKEALDYAIKYSKKSGKEKTDKFIRMYVNELSLNMGIKGKKAIELFLEKGKKIS